MKQLVVVIRRMRRTSKPFRAVPILLLVLWAASTVLAQGPNQDAGIFWPTPDTVLSERGLIPVIGTASVPGMSAYFLEYTALDPGQSLPDPDAVWLPATLPAATPVRQGALGNWDTTALGDGAYALRLTINVSGGQPVRAVVSPVIVGSQVIGAAVPPPMSAPGTAHPGKIAFVSRDYDLCILDLGSSDSYCITTPGFHEYDPDWSPDGTQLVFEGVPVNGGSGDYHIYVVNADGSNMRRLTYDVLNAFQPAWSPDGQTIVFTAVTQNHEWDLYSIHPDGTGLRNLTQTGMPAEGPAWSPDGRQIVFNGSILDDAEELVEMLCLLDVTSGKVSVLIDNQAPSFSFQYPAWSPDGQQIAFQFRLPGGNTEIRAIDLATGIIRVLTTDPGQNQRPAWSPDGTQIMYLSDRLNPDVDVKVFVMNADGSNVQPARSEIHDNAWGVAWWGPR